MKKERLKQIWYMSDFKFITFVEHYVMKWEGKVARMGEKLNKYRTLVGKSEGKRPLRRPRRRWVDNIKMNLKR
jgi:hypothetical protein